MMSNAVVPPGCQNHLGDGCDTRKERELQKEPSPSVYTAIFLDNFPITKKTVDNFPYTGKIVDMFPYTGDINLIVSGHVEVVVLLSRA